MSKNNNEIISLNIIPAKFAMNKDNNRCIVKCYVGNSEDGKPIVQKRIFDRNYTDYIENPTYLFIGIIHGPSYTQINFVDAKDFEKLFVEKWGCLDLTADSSDKKASSS